MHLFCLFLKCPFTQVLLYKPNKTGFDMFSHLHITTMVTQFNFKNQNSLFCMVIIIPIYGKVAYESSVLFLLQINMRILLEDLSIDL